MSRRICIEKITGRNKLLGGKIFIKYWNNKEYKHPPHFYDLMVSSIVMLTSDWNWIVMKLYKSNVFALNVWSSMAVAISWLRVMYTIEFWNTSALLSFYCFWTSIDLKNNTIFLWSLYNCFVFGNCFWTKNKVRYVYLL